MNPRGLRARLLLTVIVGSAVLVAILVVAFNLVLGSKLSRDANDLLRQRAAAHLTTLTITDGQLRARESPDDAAPDAPIWVYAGKPAIERPAADRASQRAADALAGGPRRFMELAPTDVRLYAVPITRSGSRVGTLVSAVGLAPYESSARTAVVASIVFGLLALLAIAVAGHWAIAAALRPVARMTAAAADRSEHDLDARFSLGEPHDELTRLAATFDTLLARIGASLRHEQRFSAEVSHELRTPLAKLRAEAELALRRERSPAEYRAALGSIGRECERMQRTLETLLSAERATIGPRATGDARRAASRALETCTATAQTRALRMHLEAPDHPVRVAAEAEVLERILVPLVENGCRYAQSAVTVAVEQSGTQVRVTISDDGPGVPKDIRERIFDPGYTDGSRPTNGHAGAGLGLPLARRLARAVEGEIEYVAEGPGATFRVRLPST